MIRPCSALIFLLLLGGCGDDSSPPENAADSALDLSAADATVSDAPPGDASAVDAELPTRDMEAEDLQVDAGAVRVPVFLAIGWGGRHLVSCDRGRSWVGDTFESTEDDWHQSFTPKSLHIHDGLFVRMTGWGTDSTVHSSRDGVNWTSVALEGVRAGAVGYDGRWIALSARRVYESNDALEWNEIEGVEGARLNRDGAVHEGIWISGTDGVVRHNRGEDWVELESCSGARHGSIGVHGGFAAGPDRIVSFGAEGTTCVVSRDTGEDLGAGDMGADRIQGVGAYINGEFWLGSSDTLFRSADGLSWRRDELPDGVRFNLLAEGDGTIVAANRNGDAFFYSEDSGETWSEADGPEGNNLYRMGFGWAEPSELCPGE